MLGKLMKYEWKSLCKVGAVMVLAVTIVTIIGCILLSSFGDVIIGEQELSEVQTVIWVLVGLGSLVMYLVMLMGVMYGIYIFSGVNFYKTMYSEQGYLSHTLPVTPNQLLISKIFVSGLWYLLIELAVVISIIALASSLLTSLLAEGMAELGCSNLWEFIGMAMEEMPSEMGMELAGFKRAMIVLAVYALIMPFASMTILFGSLTLGQLSGKYKLVMGILAYFGIYFLQTLINMVVQMVSTVNYSIELLENSYATMDMSGAYLSTMIVSILMAVLLYASSYFILTKKLNME